MNGTDKTPPARGPSLRIIAVNDVYTIENLPRLRGLVAHHATHDPADVQIVTLAGDFVSPSILSSIDHGRGMVDCMNAVGVGYVTFGNHEDDIPPEELRLRVREFQGVWLGTNVRGFTPVLPTHAVLEVRAKAGRSVRVGLLGVVMDDPAIYRRAPFGGVEITPPNACARAEARRLMREEGCAVVVPLTHQDAAQDRALAEAQRDPSFPVIVGGHEHTVLLEQVAGTWVIKAGADAVHAVIIDLVWPLEAPAPGVADLPSVTVRLEDVATYPEDPALSAHVAALLQCVQALEAATLVPLGPCEVLSSVGTRARQTSFGSLVCSRVRDALDADGCLFNGGGIRASREYRARFTYGDLKAEVPFENEVVVVEMPGSVVRDAVEASRARSPVESGGFLQVDDQMAVDGSGRRVTEVGGEALDLARCYRIAVVRNLFAGLDHIEPLVRFAREHPEKIPQAGTGREIKMILVDALCLALFRQLGSFDAMDADHDGVLTAADLSLAIARLLSEPPSSVTAGLVLGTLDVDRDGHISREEAAASARSPARKPPHDC